MSFSQRLVKAMRWVNIIVDGVRGFLILNLIFVSIAILPLVMLLDILGESIYRKKLRKREV